jgi:N6-L-threonylcarbamoyladenine synthase
LGHTLDDAVGEAFDKVAKALGLGYPGGPVISKLAKQGNPKAINFPRALMHSGDLQFSLSGLKTAVVTYIRQQQELGNRLNVPDVAASFEQAVIDVQVAKALTACKQTSVKTFCIGGGVAANQALRQAYKKVMDPAGIRVIFPPQIACTDNAAMIARVALDRYQDGKFAGLGTDAQAHADLEQPY